jgi:hypothetical protein
MKKASTPDEPHLAQYLQSGICENPKPTEKANSAGRARRNPKGRGWNLLPYFCRACGEALPLGSRNLFHSQCLREDKRRRTREDRQREHERFGRWLSRQVCPRCGAELGTVARRPRPTAGPPREASQGAVERSPNEEKAVNAGRRLGAGIGQNEHETGSGK